MGVGHLAASFALRSRFVRIPLLVLLLAGVFVDLLWGLFVLGGLEHAHIDTGNGSAVPLSLDSVPWSHSLVAGIFWGALVGAAWFALRSDGSGKRDLAGALLLFALVVSHWVLDFASHLPEMPVFFSGPLVGLGLWRSRTASVLVETAMIVIGLALYWRSSQAKDKIGSVGFAVLAFVLVVAGAGAYFGPPPPSITPMAAGNLVLLIPLVLADRMDRHRSFAASS